MGTGDGAALTHSNSWLESVVPRIQPHGPSPILRGPPVDNGEVLQLAEFLRHNRRALVRGNAFNPGKLADKLFHGWMPSQTFIDIAANALGPHTIERIGESAVHAQLPPSRDLEEHPQCPNTLLPVVQCSWVQDGETAFYSVRLHLWLRISATPPKAEVGRSP